SDRLGYDSCAVLRLEGGHLVLEASTGRFPEHLKGRRIGIGSGITGQCARQRRIINVGDVRTHPDYIPSGIEGVRSEVACPLLFQEQLLGVFVIASLEENAFDEEDVRLLSILGAQAAVGIHNARTYAEAEQKALTDALTGLYNYRY